MPDHLSVNRPLADKAMDHFVYRKQYAYRFGRQCYGLAPYDDCPYKDDPWKTWWQRGWKDVEREKMPRPAWMAIGKTIGDAIKRRA